MGVMGFRNTVPILIQPVKESGKGLKERLYPGEDILGQTGSRGSS